MEVGVGGGREGWEQMEEERDSVINEREETGRGEREEGSGGTDVAEEGGEKDIGEVVERTLETRCKVMVRPAHLVHPHRGHLQQLRHGVHHRDRRPALVLPLPQVQNRHHRCLLVLGRVSADDLVGALEVLGVELEGDLRGISGLSQSRS